MQTDEQRQCDPARDRCRALCREKHDRAQQDQDQECGDSTTSFIILEAQSSSLFLPLLFLLSYHFHSAHPSATQPARSSLNLSPSLNGTSAPSSSPLPTTKEHHFCRPMPYAYTSTPEALYKQILTTSTSQSEEGLRDQEAARVRLGELYRDQKYAFGSYMHAHKYAEGLAEVVNRSRAFMSSTAKAKTAKLIRTLLDYFAAIPDSQKVQMKALTDSIAWANQEKRIFLQHKHSLEARLVGLCSRQYQPALALIDTQLTELKRIDNKMILAEVHLLESRVYRGLGKMPKAKVYCVFSFLFLGLRTTQTYANPHPTQASLIPFRTAANAIYCLPSLQLDLQSDILHTEEKDYSTAYSYFFEAFEKLSALGEIEGGSERGVVGAGKALKELEYMLLREHPAHHQPRPAVRVFARRGEYVSRRARAPEAGFEGVLGDVEGVSGQLSKMILDKVLYGVLDQGRGCLVIYDEPKADVSLLFFFLSPPPSLPLNTYGAAIETLEQISKVVESLYAKNSKALLVGREAG
ncbi:LOW QUALITY PROTEIN: hypothetical protein CVT25_000101 [Psilocybe cyanescens]|uniref:PCI domain-containing protein n=1 Tax=Psilocybe cyanescens TaxID=93625 RepID=A0A409XQE3_PSICY|nr:LOW QUALITY PROTEIN: hypothetical protein CVT25_000101 [Psilocybe cyanescens]